jgi:hypothetical protein
LNEAGADRVGRLHEHDWDGLGRLQQQRSGRGPNDQKDVRCERNQFRRGTADRSGLTARQAMFDLQVSANRPPQLLEALLKQRCSYLCLRIVGCEWDEHADASHALALLCMSGERPDHYCAAEKCDEVAPLHMHVVKDRALCSGLRLALDDVNVRFGSKADIRAAKSHVRFTPKKRHQLRHKEMSALGHKRTHAVQQSDRYFTTASGRAISVCSFRRCKPFALGQKRTLVVDARSSAWTGSRLLFDLGNGTDVGDPVLS